MSCKDGATRFGSRPPWRTLSDKQREAIDLLYFEGLTHSEIGIKIGSRLGTVKMRVRLGIEKLARLLKDGGR